MTLKLLQFNCQSIIPNKNKIEFFINKYNYDIVILSEIFACNENFKILNYNTIFKTRNDNYGGVAILLKKNINFKKIKYTTPYDIIIVETSNLKVNFKIASVYFPPNTVRVNEFEREMRSLTQFFSNDENVIIAGDFNARHVEYGDSICLPRGTKLKNLIDITDFTALNNGSHTFNRYQDNALHSSVLDLTFTNSVQEIKWKTLKSPITGSHHLPIHMEVENSARDISSFICLEELKTKLKVIKLDSNINNITSLFQDEIKKCTMKNSKFVPKSWWSVETGRTYQLYKAAFQKLNKFFNQENQKIII